MAALGHCLTMAKSFMLYNNKAVVWVAYANIEQYEVMQLYRRLRDLG